ncbi:peptidyl-prolyl cis-trans isomerase cyclophilin type [Pseudopedobacter saltans DSM 12145]|uniref:peptidylprolyl isomerase n=1 Tax=Pseudopedobacter saltans (strain ATCC 51119 / DSM 12145 / JCM 21818 / CCUG 39354 / LMG 10337 / NBRC 100064 / NCIMB 13643) TaxID=762903 RepID=F0SAQ6_PSESL|nr:peptidylprolyl isomerase [Pseudopedobacter saltans]ADY53677.1 peptidyl-prolyl cis-trans isomerase cyclophilin type [Pseudopedobacter saltans DSM 12145]
MRKALLCLLFVFGTVQLWAAKPKDVFIKISTNKGDMILKLFNETPKHRDNFVKIIKAGTLEKTLFHRVIKGFMIQGGDPDSKNAKENQLLGMGDLGYTIPAEFNPGLIHKKGALAAARNNNPERASSASQFYIVEGKVYNDMQLNYMEQDKGVKISEEHKAIYKTIGGTPFLDGEYTVFGETLRGLDVLDAISSVKVDKNNRPVENISMKVSLLKKKEIRKLLKNKI